MFLTDKVSFPYGLTLQRHAGYICLLLLRANLYWLRKLLILWALSSPDLFYDIVSCTPSSFYCVIKIKFFHNFKSLTIYFYVWKSLYYICLLISRWLTFEIFILFQFTPDTTTSVMHPTTAKQTEDGITPYTLFANSKRKLFYIIFPVVSLLIIIFFFFNVYSQPFYHQCSFWSSWSLFRASSDSVNNVKLSA